MKNAAHGIGMRSRRARLTALASFTLALSLGMATPATATQATTERATVSSSPDPGSEDCGKDPKRGCKQQVDVGASVFRNAQAQLIPSGTPTQILFDQALYDTDAMFDPVNSTLVVNTPGRYLLNANISWGKLVPGVNDFYSIFLQVNGSNIAFNEQVATAAFATQAVTTVLELEEGDVISLMALQNTDNDAVSGTVFGNNFDPLAPVLQAELLEPGDPA
ncbi:hypothetical protein [Streptomyces pacificus]|uniref:C1q domain-containing protein n=1 Tax=Streptomyces pacificus TaxID=2705029 RepID=A0A6A0AVZ6_9ACTN|nr:hypothetical protein [Streptomyces pacificus]GFH35757.1 hypothetical protein SCWH03_19790 [Streptomyces pacificus]